MGNKQNEGIYGTKEDTRIHMQKDVSMRGDNRGSTKEHEGRQKSEGETLTVWTRYSNTVRRMRGHTLRIGRGIHYGERD